MGVDDLGRWDEYNLRICFVQHLTSELESEMNFDYINQTDMALIRGMLLNGASLNEIHYITGFDVMVILEIKRKLIEENKLKK